MIERVETAGIRGAERERDAGGTGLGGGRARVGANVDPNRNVKVAASGQHAGKLRKRRDIDSRTTKELCRRERDAAPRTG